MSQAVEISEHRKAPYKELWDLQHVKVQEHIEAKKASQTIPHKLLLVEHKPVYTFGKSANEDNLLIDRESLKDRGIDLFNIERGGDITFHGLGQWVAYPIFDLEQLGIGLRVYIEKLEDVLINTCAHYGIKSQRVEGLTGVWVNNGSTWNKIAAIGVMSKRYITMHGFALNVNTDLEYFNLMNPCGITDKGVTTIGKELDRVMDMNEVKHVITDQFIQVFGLSIS